MTESLPERLAANVVLSNLEGDETVLDLAQQDEQQVFVLFDPRGLTPAPAELPTDVVVIRGEN